VPHKAQLEFEEMPPDGWVGQIADELVLRGVRVHMGSWLIPGKPRVLLLELDLPGQRLAEAKYRLWKDHHVACPDGDPLIDSAVAFAEVARELLEIASRLRHGRGGGVRAPQRIVAHFHEWQAGVAIPLVRRAQLAVCTVFTTHATLLGRYIASSEEDFYHRLAHIDQAEAAARYNVRTQHNLERAAVHGSHVFTTVSQITAEECAALLGRAPDVVTPNGLNIARYNVGHDFQTFHANFKEQVHAFTMGHFFPSYAFDLDRTLYVFTSGRYEPRNKGFDLCLESMARLNLELKHAQLGVTVVFFIITNRPTRSIHPRVLEKRGVLTQLRMVCDNIVDRVGEQLFRNAAAGERSSLDALVDEYWQLRFRRTQAAFRVDQLPLVGTHVLDDDADDPTLNHIRALGLFNGPEDPVKVVYHPEFISPVNPLWGMEYEQFVRGCHLGLFPSAYEPWGYTPLECMALGTPAISSDLAGFGRYVHDTYEGHDGWGLTVLARRGRSFHDAAKDLAEDLLAYCTLSRRDRVNLRNEVEKRSWDFDWSKLCVAYHDAYQLALERGA
jgi:glycogen(starch) synthase